MTYRGALVALALALACTGGVASAHHSGAMFDRSKKTTQKGTIKEFIRTNPHTWVTLVVTTDAGATEEWGLEGGSPNILARADLRWNGHVMKPGDAVVMTISPVRDGRKMGVMESVVLSDGVEMKFSGL